MLLSVARPADQTPSQPFPPYAPRPDRLFLAQEPRLRPLRRYEGRHRRSHRPHSRHRAGGGCLRLRGTGAGTDAHQPPLEERQSERQRHRGPVWRRWPSCRRRRPHPGKSIVSSAKSHIRHQKSAQLQRVGNGTCCRKKAQKGAKTLCFLLHNNARWTNRSISLPPLVTSTASRTSTTHTKRSSPTSSLARAAALARKHFSS